MSEKRCPEDADTVNKSMCMARSQEKNYFVCTREKGHEGLHHAHGMTKNCLKKWRQ